jgi:hypothetical protein
MGTGPTVIVSGGGDQLTDAELTAIENSNLQATDVLAKTTDLDGDTIALRTTLQGQVLRTAILEEHVAGTIMGGFYDVFPDDSMIDMDNSSGIVYDESKCIETDDALVVTSEPASTADFTQPDLKGTITYWEKTSTGKGRFKTAIGGSVVTVGAGQTNPLVIPGTLINDLRTVCYIDGDGSASDSVWLDSDLASGAVNTIYGLIIVDGKVQPNQVANPHGVANSSTTIITSSMSNSNTPSPLVASATSYLAAGDNFEAYQAFNQSDGTESHSGSWIGDGVPTSGSPQSLMIDLGTARCINKYILKSRWATTQGYKAFPKTWTLEGTNTGVIGDASGANGWVVLDTVAESTEPGQNSWEAAYHTFSNVVSYRYYRLHITDRYGSEAYVSINELKLVENLEIMTYPSPAIAIAAGDCIINTSEWSGVTATGDAPIAITETLNGSSTAYYAFSRNHGEADELWVASDQSGVARLSSGTWQYYDAGWTSATANNRFQALTDALGVSATQALCDGATWEATDNDSWAASEGDNFAWAVLMEADGDNLPQFDKIVVSYSAGNAVFISKAFTIPTGQTKALLSVLVKGITILDTISVFVSAPPSGGDSWQECITLTKVADDVGGTGIHQYTLAEKTLSAASGTTMKVRVLMNFNVGQEFHGYCGMYSNGV